MGRDSRLRFVHHGDQTWLNFSTTLSNPVGAIGTPQSPKTFQHSRIFTRSHFAKSSVKKAKSPRKRERDNARAAAHNLRKKLFLKEGETSESEITSTENQDSTLNRENPEESLSTMIFTNTALHQPVAEREPSPDNHTDSPPEDSQKKSESDLPGGRPPLSTPSPVFNSGARSVPGPSQHYYTPSRLPTASSPPQPSPASSTPSSRSLMAGKPAIKSFMTSEELDEYDLLMREYDLLMEKRKKMHCTMEKHVQQQRSKLPGTQFSQQ